MSLRSIHPFVSHGTRVRLSLGRVTAALAWWCLVIASSPIRAERVDFNRDVRPILSNRCFACHGPDEEKIESGLRLDSAAAATAPADSGSPAIAPGDSQASSLIERVTSNDEDQRMPPSHFGAALTHEEVETLRRWIDQGADYAVHWSFAPIQRKPAPLELTPAEADRMREAGVEPSSWLSSPVDAWVRAGLRERGWSPSPPADPLVLMRRVALDLTGLPPSLEDQAMAEQAWDDVAYERYVDKLLASPAYGEHWGRKWLDLARYADSAGYADDVPRTIWGYRDWVIRAINAGMPLDRFTELQLAGDLVPAADDDALIATAFHRNTLTNNEGGTSDEEFRNAAIVDRVNTTMAVWMGVTMACAQCHTHKFDPITQTEYFRVFAIFNQTEDNDQRDERPRLERYSADQAAMRRVWQGQLDELDRQLAEASAKPAGETEPSANDQATKLKFAREALAKQLQEMQPALSVPIQREVAPDQRRRTYVQLRGNYKVHGDEVTPGVPAVFHQPDLGSTNQAMNRLDLARWLMRRDNPLTPRVLANRFWESLFGTGLVRTSEEFGSQGELPSHPELLDYLALRLIELDWDSKRFLRELVLTQAYQQRSSVTPERYEADPDNRYLSRGPRFRVSAEQVRDVSLAAAGLLSRRMYGEPSRPPQPKSGLTAAFGGGTDWEASAGEDRFRRGVYTLWRRSNPYPSMATFDAPNREVCTLKRDRTNTPLQALVTLNDPVYVEAAQWLARRVRLFELPTADDAARLDRMMRLALSRPPRDSERAVLLALLQSTREDVSADPVAARALAGDGVPEDAVTEAAAWTVLSNVVLNVDEMLMTR